MQCAKLQRGVQETLSDYSSCDQVRTSSQILLHRCARVKYIEREGPGVLRGVWDMATYSQLLLNPCEIARRLASADFREDRHHRHPTICFESQLGCQYELVQASIARRDHVPPICRGGRSAISGGSKISPPIARLVCQGPSDISGTFKS